MSKPFSTSSLILIATLFALLSCGFSYYNNNEGRIFTVPSSVPDIRDTLRFSDYIHGENAHFSAGHLPEGKNGYLRSVFRFKATQTIEPAALLQTAPLSLGGARLEVSGALLKFIGLDFEFSFSIDNSRWYSAELEIDNMNFVKVKVDNKTVIDFSLSDKQSFSFREITIGGNSNSNESDFIGEIRDVSLTKSIFPPVKSSVINSSRILKNYIFSETDSYEVERAYSLPKVEKNKIFPFFNLNLRFRVADTDGYPNVFQTDPVNNGIRLEISGKTAALVAADENSPSDLKGLILTDNLVIGRWYELEIHALSQGFIHGFLDGEMVVDYHSDGLKFAREEFIIGRGFNSSRVFRGDIEEVSLEEENRSTVKPRPRYSAYVFLLSLALLILSVVLPRIPFHSFRDPQYSYRILKTFVVFGSVYYTAYFFVFGYLPSPFVWAKSETLTDLFAPLYWAYDAGRYTEWGSVYPPLNFLILKLINILFLGSLGEGVAEVRANSPLVSWGFLLLYLTVPMLVLKTRIWEEFFPKEKRWLYVLMIISTPMLFALERGNLIILCPVLLALAISQVGLLRCLYMALLVNLKPYFVVLLAFYFIKKEWKWLFQCVALSGFIFAVSASILQTDAMQFFANIFNFSQDKTLFPFMELMAMPSSISAFARLVTYPNYVSDILPLSFAVFGGILAFGFTILQWASISAASVLLLRKSSGLLNSEILCVLTVVITNLGVWVGGYSLVFYLALIPIFYNMKFRYYYLGLLGIMAMPLDIVPLWGLNIGEQFSFLSQSDVTVYWTLGAGSIVRPLANFTLLVLLCREMLVRNPFNSSIICLSPPNAFGFITFPKLPTLGVLGLLVVITFYNMLFFNRYLPVTEGWFSVYGSLIGAGLIPYRDFYLFLTPLYPLLMSGFQFAFGEGFYALRVFGVVVLCLIGLLTYLILVRRVSPVVAMISTFVAVVYYQSGVAHIGYDFIQVFSLFFLVATYLMLIQSDRIQRYAQSGQSYSRNLLFLSGIFVSLAFLIKQSNGALVVVFSVLCVAYITSLERGRRRLSSMLVYMLGMAFPVLVTMVWLYSVEALIPFFEQVVFGAMDSKGSLSEILFSWIGRHFNYIFLSRLLIFASALAALLMLVRLEKFLPVQKWIPKIDGNYQALSIVMIALICLFTISISHDGLGSALPYLLKPGYMVASYLLPISVTFLILTLIIAVAAPLWRRELEIRDLAICVIMSIGLIFGNGTSAGIGEVSLFLVFALFVSLVLALHSRYILPKLMVGLPCLSFVMLLSGAKFNEPYNWWYVSEPDVRASSIEAQTIGARGFLLSKDSAAVIDETVDIINKNTEKDDAIFTFPNIPGYYLLSDRLPNSKVIVSWFDFLPDHLAREEAKRLLRDPPAAIVNLNLPDTVWEAHEDLFRQGKHLGQRDILSSITSLTITQGLYDKHFSQEVSPGCTIQVWIRKTTGE